MKFRLSFSIIIFFISLISNAEEVTRGGWIGNTNPGNGVLEAGVYENHNAPKNLDPYTCPKTDSIYDDISYHNTSESSVANTIGQVGGYAGQGTDAWQIVRDKRHEDYLKKAEQAQKKADSAQQEANQAQKRADSAQRKADRAAERTPKKAERVQENANRAQEKADNAQKKADKAKGNAQKIQNSADSIGKANDFMKYGGGVFTGLEYGGKVFSEKQSSSNCQLALEAGDKETFIKEFNKMAQLQANVRASLIKDVVVNVGGAIPHPAVKIGVLIGDVAAGMIIDVWAENLDFTESAEITWAFLYEGKSECSIEDRPQEDKKEESKPVKMNKHSVY